MRLFLTLMKVGLGLGISTTVGQSMPNPVYSYILNKYGL